jgi:hypothetical protein
MSPHTNSVTVQTRRTATHSPNPPHCHAPTPLLIHYTTAPVLAHVDVAHQSKVEAEEPPPVRQRERKVRLFLLIRLLFVCPLFVIGLD